MPRVVAVASKLIRQLAPSGSRHSASERVPVGPRAAYCHGRPQELVFEVDLPRCVSYLHYSFDAKGWHPYTACLAQMEADSSLTYETSILREYYLRFRPTSQCEAYFEQCDNRFHPLNCRSPFEVLEPWSASRRRFKSHGGRGNQNFGPVTDEFGRHEFARLRKLRRSIIERGYRPEKYGYIEGFFLRWGSDYRFHITDGFHRAPVLAVTGYFRIRVSFSPGQQRIVDIADIERWPQVEDLDLSQVLARKVFLRHFEENVLEKASHIGIA